MTCMEIRLFILCFYPLSNLQRPQNDCIVLPLCVPLVEYPLHAPLCCGRLLLVGCCVLVCRLATNKCHHVLYFYKFCVAPFDVPNVGTLFPHALHPPRATSPDSHPPTMLTLDWLLWFPFMFRPPKAKATPIALFFDGVCTGVSNKGTGRGTAKPDHGHLA